MLVRVFSVLALVLCCSISYAEEAVEISLSEIWAHDMPGTRRIHELAEDPKRDHPLMSDIWKEHREGWDFDLDGDVDGRDFMEWQRGESPTPFSSSDLADCQNNYGAGSLSTATAVPEPTSAMLAALVVMGIVLRRHQTAV